MTLSQIITARDGKATPSAGRLNLYRGLHLAGVTTLFVLAVGAARADEGSVAQAASEAFAAHCFSPFMTADRADERLAFTGARVEFYDLDPLSDGPISPVIGRAATHGTDRRCEVAFDGNHAELAESAALAGLEMEGIDTVSPVPDRYQPTEGTRLLAARRLNPARVAVVHVGTRPGPNGVETFLLVERLTPLEPVE